MSRPVWFKVESKEGFCNKCKSYCDMVRHTAHECAQNKKRVKERSVFNYWLAASRFVYPS